MGNSGETRSTAASDCGPRITMRNRKLSPGEVACGGSRDRTRRARIASPSTSGGPARELCDSRNSSASRSTHDLSSSSRLPAGFQNPRERLAPPFDRAAKTGCQESVGSVRRISCISNSGTGATSLKKFQDGKSSLSRSCQFEAGIVSKNDPSKDLKKECDPAEETVRWTGKYSVHHENRLCRCCLIFSNCAEHPGGGRRVDSGLATTGNALPAGPPPRYGKKSSVAQWVRVDRWTYAWQGHSVRSETLLLRVQTEC